MSWPPTITPSQESALLSVASDYSLAHGLILRPPILPTESSPSTTTSIHGPYSLYPSPFPRPAFEKAIQLQEVYNALYAHVTVDDKFLDKVVGEKVSKVDEFQGELYKIWKQVKSEGIKQPLHLGLFRSDYLLHCPTPSTPLQQASLKQVEFNTISSSFGPLSTKVTQLHRYLKQSGAYPPNIDGLTLGNMPENGALKGLAAGLAVGHKAYGNSEARILMVVQDGERNAFDQRALEYELLETHNLPLLRVPFSALPTALTLSSDSKLLLTHPSLFSSGPVEISLVYYRAGYTPTDYTSPAIWATRLLIERSLAIKCPTVALQLAGSKKVQQVLSDPVELSSFLGIGTTSSTLSPPPLARLSADNAKELLESFTSLYPLDDSQLGKEALKMAYETPEKFVLKPQREGGGNNVYRGDIPGFLDALAKKDEGKKEGEPREREGYILMDLIIPPSYATSTMVKAGSEVGVRDEVISELGVYGVMLFKSVEGAEEGAEVLVNETVGHLLRTKGRESDEGGVAVGFSVIDSPLLI